MHKFSTLQVMPIAALCDGDKTGAIVMIDSGALLIESMNNPFNNLKQASIKLPDPVRVCDFSNILVQCL